MPVILALGTQMEEEHELEACQGSIGVPDGFQLCSETFVSKKQKTCNKPVCSLFIFIIIAALCALPTCFCHVRSQLLDVIQSRNISVLISKR